MRKSKENVKFCHYYKSLTTTREYPADSKCVKKSRKEEAEWRPDGCNNQERELNEDSVKKSPYSIDTMDNEMIRLGHPREEI